MRPNKVVGDYPLDNIEICNSYYTMGADEIKYSIDERLETYKERKYTSYDDDLIEAGWCVCIVSAPMPMFDKENPPHIYNELYIEPTENYEKDGSVSLVSHISASGNDEHRKMFDEYSIYYNTLKAVEGEYLSVEQALIHLDEASKGIEAEGHGSAVIAAQIMCNVYNAEYKKGAEIIQQKNISENRREALAELRHERFEPIVSQFRDFRDDMTIRMAELRMTIDDALRSGIKPDLDDVSLCGSDMEMLVGSNKPALKAAYKEDNDSKYSVDFMYFDGDWLKLSLVNNDKEFPPFVEKRIMSCEGYKDELLNTLNAFEEKITAVENDIYGQIDKALADIKKI